MRQLQVRTPEDKSSQDRVERVSNFCFITHNTCCLFIVSDEQNLERDCKNSTHDKVCILPCAQGGLEIAILLKSKKENQ